MDRGAEVSGSPQEEGAGSSGSSVQLKKGPREPKEGKETPVESEPWSVRRAGAGDLEFKHLGVGRDSLPVTVEERKFIVDN